MPASGNGEWGALEALWQRAAPADDAPPALRRRAAGRRLRLLRDAVWDYLLLLGAVVLFVVLVRHGTSLERLVWAFGVLAFAVHAVVEGFNLRRELWHAAAQSTEAYLSLALAHVGRRLRLVGLAWKLYGAIVLLDAALWVARYLGDPASLAALRERAVLTVFAFSLFTAALAAWSLACAWRGRAERAALEALRREPDPG